MSEVTSDEETASAARGALIAITGIVIAMCLVAGIVWLIVDPATTARAEVAACREEILKSASHPSTVAFDRNSAHVDKSTNGGYQVRLVFEAKNSYGLATRHEATCSFSAGGAAPEQVGVREVKKQ